MSRGVRPTSIVAITISAAAVTVAVAVAACGGKAKPAAPPVIAHEDPKPPPPPPACVKAGAEMSAIGSAGADASSAHFCVSDGSDTNQCFTVELAGGELAKSASPGGAQSPALADARARVETTPTEVKVCAGGDETACKTFKPAVPKNAQNPIEAVTNAQGTLAVVMSGAAEKGRGVAEVWDVATGKKLTAIKYAKGDYKCGHARVLGETIFVSADVCAGPAAHGTLFTSKGKRLADVGGKEFGTYGAEPMQIKDDVWAFLEENGAAIALQNVKTGKLAKTIDVGAIWAQEVAAVGADGDDGAAATPPSAGEAEQAAKKKPPAGRAVKPAGAAPASDAPPAPAMGNPGESALVRGGDGTLVVISGGPTPGNIALVTVDSGETKVLHARACKEE